MMQARAVDRAPVDRPRDRWTPRGPSDWLFVLGIVAVAFVVRALPLLRGAGLDGHLGYDDGVYFGAAVALTHGVLPYRDFLLLHPPGITVLLAPFALIGGVTSDATGFALGRLAFMALGAINAGLVTVLAGRYGRRAGVLAGLLYAVWFAAARVERTTDLLGPETTLLLVAMFVVGRRRPLTTRRAIAGGIALGIATAIQVWMALPVAVIVVMVARGARSDPWRPASGLLAGVAAGFGAVCLPFVVSAPTQFVRYVILDQLSRPSLGVSPLTRLRALEGLSIGTSSVSTLLAAAVVGAALVGFGAVILVARRVPAARVWCVLAVVETAYLMVSPVFLSHYSAWVAPSAAIVIGTAVALVIDALERHRPLGIVAKAAWIGVVAALALGVPRHQGGVLEAASLEADLDGARCVAADAPDLLLVTTGLRRDIQNGCPLVLDPTGLSYETDRGRLAAGAVSVARRRAPGYQTAMEEYYDDSGAAMFTRVAADGLSASTQEEITDELSDVVKQGDVTVMRRGATTLP